MAFRRAGLEEASALVEDLLAEELQPVTAWMLAPADDPADARVRHGRWAVETYLRTGTVLVDDRGTVVAVTPQPLLPEITRTWDAARLTTAEAAPPISGLWVYPALPTGCLERLHRYANAVALATPPRPMVAVTSLRPVVPSAAAWAAVEAVAAMHARPPWVYADGRQSAGLEALGLSLVVSVPVEGSELVVEGWGVSA